MCRSTASTMVNLDALNRFPAADTAQAFGLSVIVPVYNERVTIESVIARVLEQPIVTEIIVVDDGSTDGTSDIIASARWPDLVRVLRHPVNRGKGAAIRTGVGKATQGIIIIHDPTLPYDPPAYHRGFPPLCQRLP